VEFTQGATQTALVSLALSIGPVIVFSLALAKGLHRIKFSQVDEYSAALTLIGIVVWLCTKNPIAALWMSVVVDAISNVPCRICCP
jgi:hypothetical protein